VSYFYSIFGGPASNESWGWRYEGQHISLSWTSIDGAEISNTPALYGANPREFLDDAYKGTRILKDEEDFGKALNNNLTS